MSNPSSQLQWKHDLDPAVLRCDAQTAAAVRDMVRRWPRFTEGQKAKLAALLAPPDQSGGEPS